MTPGRPRPPARPPARARARPAARPGGPSPGGAPPAARSSCGPRARARRRSAGRPRARRPRPAGSRPGRRGATRPASRPAPRRAGARATASRSQASSQGASSSGVRIARAPATSLRSSAPVRGPPRGEGAGAEPSIPIPADRSILDQRSGRGAIRSRSQCDPPARHRAARRPSAARAADPARRLGAARAPPRSPPAWRWPAPPPRRPRPGHAPTTTASSSVRPTFSWEADGGRPTRYEVYVELPARPAQGRRRDAARAGRQPQRDRRRSPCPTTPGCAGSSAASTGRAGQRDRRGRRGARSAWPPPPARPRSPARPPAITRTPTPLFTWSGGRVSSRWSILNPAGTPVQTGEVPSAERPGRARGAPRRQLPVPRRAAESRGGRGPAGHRTGSRSTPSRRAR